MVDIEHDLPDSFLMKKCLGSGHSRRRNPVLNDPMELFVRIPCTDGELSCGTWRTGIGADIPV